MQNITMHRFGGKSQMAKAVAEAMAKSVMAFAPTNDTPMTIALAGGETPKPVYRLLSKMKLPWHRVQFLATDERITEDKTRSNENMLTTILGAKANICKLQQNLPAPHLHLALLGMGADGHLASLFADAMPDDDETNITKVSPAAMPEERLTLPMATLAAAARLLIVITGEEKRQMLSRPPSSSLPITALLEKRKTPAEVFHAPD